MRFEELLQVIATEKERTVTRRVGPLTTGQIARANSGGLMLTELLATDRGDGVDQTVRYAHVLGPPATPDAIDDWKEHHPGVLLPRDLEELLFRADGIHLWANAETRRSYAGLAPIAEWEIARTKMYGSSASEALLEDRYIAISYSEDNAAFVVLDHETGTYFLMDVAGPDNSSPIAPDVGELLDWFWRFRIAPKGWE